MAQRKSISVDFLRVLLGASLFALFLTVSCFGVISVAPTAENPESDLLSEEKVSSEKSLPPQSEELAAAMQSAVIEYSRQKDSGLALYRDFTSKTMVIWFYTQITGNADVANAILENADKNNIPLSLAFSLAWGESRFNPNAVNTNSNTSIDRGLFQLNSNSFPNLTEADFYNPKTSAKYGLSPLRFCLDTAGNEIAALAMYNAGTKRVRSNGTPQMTLNYVSGIINYRNGLEELFTNQVIAAIDKDNPSLLALLPSSKQ